MRRVLRRVGCAVCVLALLMTAPPAGAAAPRVAILAQGGAEAAADLLTATLSAQPGIALVDREEMARVARERGLAVEGLTAADSRDWGALLGATFLVSVSVEPDAEEGKPPQALARVFVSGPGAILGFARAVDPQDLAAPVLRQVQAGLSAEGEWLPLSVLQFRFPQPVPDAAIIERDLTALTVSRLAAQPGILVLERAQLLQAVFERSLVGEDDPFWSGAYLVEGTIRREGDRLVVQPLLRAPGGGAAPGIPPVEFPADRLANGAERIAAAVAEALGSAAPGEVGWSHEAESGVLLDEARWSHRHVHHQAALDLAEASLALGGSAAEIALIRVEALCRLAMAPHLSHVSMSSFRSSMSRDLWRFSLSATPESQPGRQTERAAWVEMSPGARARSSYRPSNNGSAAAREIATEPRERLGSRMAYATRALEICADELSDDDFVWIREVATLATGLLREMHAQGWEDRLQGEAADLRAWIRKARDRHHEAARDGKLRGRQRRWILERWLAFEAEWAGYWFERHEDALAAYRTLLDYPTDIHLFENIRRSLSQRFPEEIRELDPKGGRDPRMIAAHDLAPEGGERIWARFLETLTRDPSPRLRLDGHVLTALMADPSPEALPAYEKAMTELAAVADELLRSDLFQPYAHLLAGPSRHHADFDARWLAHAERWFNTSTRRLYDQYCPPFFVVFDGDGPWVPYALNRRRLTSDQFERLQAAFTRFRRRLNLETETGESMPFPLAPAAVFHDRIHRFYMDFANRYFDPAPDTTPPPLDAGHVAHRFPGLAPHARGGFLADSRFLVEDRSDRFWYQPDHRLLELDQATGTVRVLYERRGVPLKLVTSRYRGDLLLAQTDLLVRIDPRTNPPRVTEIPTDLPLRWEVDGAEVSLQINAVHVGDEGLFLFTRDSAEQTAEIYEVNVETGRSRLLASTRRRPAETPLDDCDVWYASHVVRGPDGGMWFLASTRRTRRGTQLWRYCPVERRFDHPLGPMAEFVQVVRGEGKTLFLTGRLHLLTIPDGPEPAVWLHRNPSQAERGLPLFPAAMAPESDRTEFFRAAFSRLTHRINHGHGLYPESFLLAEAQDRLWLLQPGYGGQQSELHGWRLPTFVHRVDTVMLSGWSFINGEYRQRPFSPGADRGTGDILHVFPDGMLTGIHWIDRAAFEQD